MNTTDYMPLLQIKTPTNLSQADQMYKPSFPLPIHPFQSMPWSFLPRILLSVLQTACVRILRFLTGFFLFVFFSDAPSISQDTKSVKGQFFYHSFCKNQVRTCIFNDIYALQNQHTMTLRRFILFTSALVVLDQRWYFEKYVHTSVLPANFHTNTVKYGQVGRPDAMSTT